ncbi:hypothetical protein G7Z17_g8910 [Cylindrodendrum hubeiense]|uniref:Uncharacterized protein n=1 Tax=Cylindrodendrum hubeiense TaxID=595255 RepID=A0A9P5HA86_9HYPO|nr:hypothetical protein G7Z17_g8910 [Cylindrodendrum hubeiense]
MEAHNGNLAHRQYPPSLFFIKVLLTPTRYRLSYERKELSTQYAIAAPDGVVMPNWAWFYEEPRLPYEVI